MELCTDNEHQSITGRLLGQLNHCNNIIHIAIDYSFGLFTGILLASSFYFVVYGIYKRNKPIVYPKIILPGLLSGVMWGIATSTVF